MKVPRYILTLRAELEHVMGTAPAATEVQQRARRLEQDRRPIDNIDAFILGWLDRRAGR